MDDVTENLASLEPGTLFAGYRIEGILDRGGMGVVYKAADEELDRTVALKIIAPEHTQNPDAVTRFKSEARLAASLEHPNIVPIHRGGEYHGVLYLAMRFVPGTNLRQVIDQSQLDLDRVQRVMRSVASALDAAHERGLVHRDVKPANILISGEGDREHVYLTDFGLTKQLGSPGSLTRTGAWVGHSRLRRPRADPGWAGGRPGRRLLTGLRALRDAHGERRLPQGQRHGEALGPRSGPAALAEPQPARADQGFRRRSRARDRQESERPLRQGLGGRRRGR